MGSDFQKLNDINVSEFMITEPFYTTPDEKISTTELFMLRKKIGGLPVVRDLKEKIVIGIITQRDIRLARFALAVEASKTKVRDLMSPDPIVVKLEDTLKVVLEKMFKNDIERLPVVDNNKKLIGLVIQNDILKAIYKHLTKL